MTWERLWTMSVDRRWAAAWLIGMLLMMLWDAFFLNTPAFDLLCTAVLNSFFTGALTVVGSLALGWCFGLAASMEPSRRLVRLPTLFAVNLLRSVPQILGLLAGYVVFNLAFNRGAFSGSMSQLAWMAAVTALFLSPEVADMIEERIRYYKELDFYHAMLCCGMKPARIINVEILLKNSLSHIVHKAIALFAGSLFLQCSIDFIISVGLSTEVSLSNVPVSLGSVLARLDSKQDVLAIGKALTQISYVPDLLFRHLQGLSTAMIIVYSLLCLYMTANAFVRRKGL